jgi:glycosyltransferase involved in cell wall biosynthesis
MISAIGERAKSYAQRIDNVDAILVDAEAIGNGYREAVRWRELGRSFYGLVCVDDPRIAFGYQYGEQILGQVTDYDVRRAVAGQLRAGTLPINGQPVDAAWGFQAGLEHVFVEFLWLCDAVLVRSFAERARINDWFAKDVLRRPLRPAERILGGATVPRVERVRPQRPGVVVWAPDRPALETALHLHGLAEFHGSLTCVSAGGPLPSHSAATFLAPADPGVEAALATATVVVCIDPTDPSDAVAFARLGYGVVAPESSGAHEFATGVTVLDALDVNFLFAAVAVAMARPASVLDEPEPPPRAPLQAARPDFIDGHDLPLVSIITPTYNRREELRAMLSCIAAQTYPNIESVVVNDGGEAVDDIVAAFPFARLIDKRPNAGTARAQLTGWENARGEYIGLLPDDDWLYPDHIERLMNAMFRSGARIAHSSALLRYLERLEGGWKTTGFNASIFSQTLIPSDTLISAAIGGHQALVHRSIYEDVGWYLLDSDISDNEMHIRITQRYFYAFDDHVTAEFRDHAAGQGRVCDFPAAMRQIYTEVHPVKDRPYIEQFRESSIANVARREPGKPPFPATLLLLK